MPWSEGLGIHTLALPGTKASSVISFAHRADGGCGWFFFLFHLPFVLGAVRRRWAAHCSTATAPWTGGWPVRHTQGEDLAWVTRQQINNLLHSFRGEMVMF